MEKVSKHTGSLMIQELIQGGFYIFISSVPSIQEKKDMAMRGLRIIERLEYKSKNKKI